MSDQDTHLAIKEVSQLTVLIVFGSDVNIWLHLHQTVSTPLGSHFIHSHCTGLLYTATHSF